MEFSCPNCKLKGRIDDGKVPEQGVYATCPKCKTRFLVKRESVPEEPQAVPKDMPPIPDATPPAPEPPSLCHESPPPVKENFARPQGGSSPGGGESFRPGSASGGNDLATFIGKNADTYLRKFAAFNVGGREGFAMTWHWPAFFVPFWWLVYRKQYLWAVLAFFISFIPYVGLLAMVGFGLTGNYIYYRYSKMKLREINALPTEAGRAVAIARAGGVSNIMWILVPLIGIAFLGIVAAIAVPQFVSYQMRGYNAAAMAELKNAKACVDNYYHKNNAYPETLEDANYRPTENVEVILKSSETGGYFIVSSHQKGDEEFAVTSDSSDLLSKSKDDESGDFVAIE